MCDIMDHSPSFWSSSHFTILPLSFIHSLTPFPFPHPLPWASVPSFSLSLFLSLSLSLEKESVQVRCRGRKRGRENLKHLHVQSRAVCRAHSQDPEITTWAWDGVRHLTNHPNAPSLNPHSWLTFRTIYIICQAQCKKKTQGPLFKSMKNFKTITTEH